MRAVVADTSPLNYLVLIGSIEILRTLFGTILIPDSVRRELLHPEAPIAVRAWLDARPDWLDVRPDGIGDGDPALDKLDIGERAAINLALAVPADLILMDDRTGVGLARAKGFPVVGTLGLIELAHARGLLEAKSAIERLQATNFRCRPDLLQAVVERSLESQGQR